MAIVAAAGPIANVIVAVLAAIVYRVLDIVGAGSFVLEIGFWVVYYNIVLAIFNLIPIPPLDGYNAMLAFLPPKTAFVVQRYAPYGIMVLLLLVLLPASPLSRLLGLAQPLTEALIGA